VEGEAGVPGKPGPDLGVLVAAVIVEDDVNEFASQDLGLDGVEEGTPGGLVEVRQEPAL
jgi:hypothetical protein